MCIAASLRLGSVGQSFAFYWPFCSLKRYHKIHTGLFESLDLSSNNTVLLTRNNQFAQILEKNKLRR